MTVDAAGAVDAIEAFDAAGAFSASVEAVAVIARQRRSQIRRDWRLRDTWIGRELAVRF